MRVSARNWSWFGGIAAGCSTLNPKETTAVSRSLARTADPKPFGRDRRRTEVVPLFTTEACKRERQGWAVGLVCKELGPALTAAGEAGGEDATEQIPHVHPKRP